MIRFTPIRNLLFLVFICLFQCIEIKAQDPVHWQLTDDDGLSSMTVYKIIQDSKGYIWMGTEGGLCRYDGQGFKKFSHPYQKDNEILSLKEDSHGRIWFSNISKQLFYYDQDSVHFFYEVEANDSIPFQQYYLSDSILYLIHTRDLVSKPARVLEFNLDSIDRSLNKLEPKISVFPFYLLHLVFIVDEYHQLFLYYNEKKNFHQSKSLNKTKQKDFFFNVSLKERPYTGITIDSNTILLYTSVKNSFYILAPNELPEKKAIRNPIRSVKKIGHRFMFLTAQGLVQSTDLNKNAFSEPVFENYTLNDIIKDNEGNYWIATDNGGVIIVPSLDFLSTNLFPSASTYSIETLSEDDFLYTAHNQGKVSIINAKKRNVKDIYDIPNFEGRVMDFTLNEQFGLILSTDNGGYYSKDVHKLNFNPFFLGYSSIKKLLNDSNQNLWIASNIGVRKFAEAEVQINYNDNYSRVINERTYALCEDIENTIWIGTISGLYTSKNDQIEPFLNPSEISSTLTISDIVQSSDSSIWVSTNNTGLLRIKNDSIIEHYDKSNFLRTNDCKDLFVDENNLLWIATDEGLYSLHLTTNKWQFINKYDGLPSNDIQAVAVKDNIVWVSTSKGLISFSKESVRLNHVAPLIYISQVSINNRDTSINHEYSLTYEENSIQIDFQGIAFRCRGDIGYEYRLLGLNDKWVETTSRFARYHALPPGSYTFEVVAINEDGIKSTQKTTLVFDISAPWWQTWWFRILAIVLIGGLIGMAFYSRFQRLRKEQRIRHDFELKVNRMRMLALQSQMNPHFIFNALNAIQLFLTTSDEENAMIYLARFAHLIRLAFEHSKEETITLDQELEFLQLYISLESLRFGNAIDVDLAISDEIKNEQYDFSLPPLLIQPVIENAFKHGLFHKKGDKKLVIKFEKEDSFLKCTIQDNGIGRQKAQEINAWKEHHEHQSSGLKNTEERLNLIHREEKANNEKSEYFMITDLFDEKKKAIGTQVDLYFKLK